jgi:hypothetical protein
LHQRVGHLVDVRGEVRDLTFAAAEVRLKDDVASLNRGAWREGWRCGRRAWRHRRRGRRRHGRRWRGRRIAWDAWDALVAHAAAHLAHLDHAGARDTIPVVACGVVAADVSKVACAKVAAVEWHIARKAVHDAALGARPRVRRVGAEAIVGRREVAAPRAAIARGRCRRPGRCKDLDLGEREVVRVRGRVPNRYVRAKYTAAVNVERPAAGGIGGATTACGGRARRRSNVHVDATRQRRQLRTVARGVEPHGAHGRVGPDADRDAAAHARTRRAWRVGVAVDAPIRTERRRESTREHLCAARLDEGERGRRRRRRRRRGGSNVLGVEAESDAVLVTVAT